MSLKDELKVKDIVYATRIMPTLGIYELCELMVRYVEDNWFTGIDKRDKRVYSFTLKDYKTRIFKKRIDALNVIKEAEKNKPKRIFTIEKEE
jgi:hypothetical protein